MRKLLIIFLMLLAGCTYTLPQTSSLGSRTVNTSNLSPLRRDYSFMPEKLPGGDELEISVISSSGKFQYQSRDYYFLDFWAGERIYFRPYRLTIGEHGEVYYFSNKDEIIEFIVKNHSVPKNEENRILFFRLFAKIYGLEIDELIFNPKGSGEVSAVVRKQFSNQNSSFKLVMNFFHDDLPELETDEKVQL